MNDYERGFRDGLQMARLMFDVIQDRLVAMSEDKQLAEESRVAWKKAISDKYGPEEADKLFPGPAK